MNDTKIYDKRDFQNEYASQIIKDVALILEERGYNPVNQIVGYILSGDPTYITSHKEARNIIRMIERDELSNVPENYTSPVCIDKDKCYFYIEYNGVKGFLENKNVISLKHEEEKKTIWKNIKSMFAYKIGGVILNNTDNILISILVSTVMVGIYSNYLMLYNKANAC